MNVQTRELAIAHESAIAGSGVTSRFVEAVRGAQVHLLEHGDGPPLTMLHGSGPTSLSAMVASIDPDDPPQMPPPSRESVVQGMAGMGEGETIVQYPDLLDAMVAAARDATSGRASLDELQALIAPDGWRREAQTAVDELEDLQQPTLMIWGRNDPLGGLEAAAATPNARLEVLDAGHAPWLGHPDTVARQVEEFLTAR